MDGVNILNFIHEVRYEELPAVVQNQARRCLLDTLGAALTGRQTRAAQIIHDYAVATFGGDDAVLWQDGRVVSAAGAALANSTTIDAFDIHDGYKMNKGHAGVALIPAAFATLRSGSTHPIPGTELLTSLVVGYEVALRAGRALHSTVADYHSSGAWNALGCAAITARRMHLNSDQTRHALGIAEYYGPRSQIMRVVDFPTMLKDGSGWGAMAGVSAAYLAAQGFTGAPALTVEDAAVYEIWQDLGKRWLMLEQYFKPYAVCRWAQPGIAAALALQRKYHCTPQNIRQVSVFTFEAATHLTSRAPQNTEEAQYSLPFPLAAALVHGKLGLEQLDGEGLQHPIVLRLAESMRVCEDPVLTSRFPAERLSRIQIEMKDGRIFESGNVGAMWDDDSPPSDDDLLNKFRELAAGTLSKSRAAALERVIWNCADLTDAALIEDVLALPE